MRIRGVMLFELSQTCHSNNAGPRHEAAGTVSVAEAWAPWRLCGLTSTVIEHPQARSRKSKKGDRMRRCTGLFGIVFVATI